MKEQFTTKNVLRLGGAFTACMIGSGFASGQEALQFISSYGKLSYAVLALLLILFTWVTATLYHFGYGSNQEPVKATYVYYLGKIVGTVFEYLVPLFLLGVYVSMASGAGAIFEESFHIPHNVGVAILVIVVLITYLLGLEKLVDIVGTLGPLLILFTIVVCIYAVCTGQDLASSDQLVQELDVMRASKYWWLSACSYAALGVGTTVPFLCSVGATAHSGKEARCGGVVGALLLSIAFVLLNCAILSNISKVYNSNVPTLVFANEISPVMGVAFSVIVLLAIYTTAAPFMWMICNKIPTKTKWQRNVVAIVIAVLVLFGGKLPFGWLVNTLYPVIGYFGFVVFIAIFVRQIRNLIVAKRQVNLNTVKEDTTNG